MDQRLLRYYNRELEHLREVGSEFATEFPKIAGRLSLDSFQCLDPYVERLLEGFAFLAARVQLKLDAEFPRLTQSLFETIVPGYLSPTPSCAIVRIEPDRGEGVLDQGPIVPRGAALRSVLGEDEQTRCIYTTAHDVHLWPLEIVEAAYLTRDLGSLGLAATGSARAALRVRLETTGGGKFADLPLHELVVHLQGDGGTTNRLYEQLMGHATGVCVHSTARPPAWERRLPGESVALVGFEDKEAMLPVDPRVFQGYRLLREYYVLPERFHFVRITGLHDAIAACEETQLDLTILLDDVDVELENAISTRNFALFCTPAANLFEKRLDRIHLSDRFSEFHLVPDRTAPWDYEIHTVKSVTGYGHGKNEGQPFNSFYRAHDMETRRNTGFYAARRTPRVLSQQERRGRRRSVSYAGSDVYVSLVDSDAAPYRGDLLQLGVTALCTNRDLPLHMPVGLGTTDFTLDTGDPVQSVRCVGKPTTPQTSLAEGEFAWRLISHLAPSYLSIIDESENEGAAALRDILRLYADASLADVRRQIEGVITVASGPVVRRIGSSGPAAFARGLEVEVTMDETAYEGSGIFLLGAVLDRFFARYVTMNVFTITRIRSAQRGEIMEWPLRLGLRQNL